MTRLPVTGRPTDRLRAPRIATPTGTIASAASAARLPTDRERVNRSPLFDLRTPFHVLRGWMHVLPIPPLLTFAQAAWYGLGVWTIGEGETPDECSLVGLRVSALAADVDGLADEYAAWGDVRGERSQIVVMRAGPAQRSQWADAPAYMPAMSGAAPDLETVYPQMDSVDNVPLPPGKYTDTAPARLIWSETYGADQYPLPWGTTIGIYLVVNGAQIQAASAAELPIRGNIDVRLRLARVAHQTRWQS